MGGARVGEVSMARSSAERVLRTWRVHPLVDRPGRTLVLLGLTLPFLYFMYWFFDLQTALTAILLLAVFLSGHLLPTTYSLTEEGVTVHSRFHRSFRPWSDFARWHAYKDAVYLIYGGSVIRSRVLRGVLLLFKDNREEVLEVVKDALPPSDGQSGPEGRLDISMGEKGGENE